jgi:hypothetical protein
VIDLTRTVACPFAGFEGCEVTYNLMASTKQLEAFQAEYGGGGTAEPIVVKITGWPFNGTDPWSKDAPMMWRIWAARRGIQRAIADLSDDPDF